MLMIMVIAGLSSLASLLNMPLQRLLVRTITRIKSSDLKLLPVVLKNLDSHNIRNRQSSMMFTLSIAFLMFVSGSLLTLVKMLEGITMQLIGTQLYCTSF